MTAAVTMSDYSNTDHPTSTIMAMKSRNRIRIQSTIDLHRTAAAAEKGRAAVSAGRDTRGTTRATVRMKELIVSWMRCGFGVDKVETDRNVFL